MGTKTIRLWTPKGVDKGLYKYERARPDLVYCWPVTKNKKYSYAIRWLGGSWYCDCPARKVCSHILGCPWKGRKLAKKHRVVSKDDVFVRAAKAARVRLTNGRIVNVYSHFWEKGRAK